MIGSREPIERGQKFAEAAVIPPPAQAAPPPPPPSAGSGSQPPTPLGARCALRLRARLGLWEFISGKTITGGDHG